MTGSDVGLSGAAVLQLWAIMWGYYDLSRSFGY